MTWRSLTRITGPASEPVTATEVYRHLRLVEDDTEKAYADAVAVVAREWVEQHTGRALLQQTYEVTFDHWWDGYVELPYPPLQSVTSVKYIDNDGVEQTLSSSLYDVFTGDPIGRIQWAYDASAPVARGEPGAIRIRFVAGYADADAVPEGLKQSILLLAAQWFENREPTANPYNAFPSEVPYTITAILSQHRSRWL